MMSMIDSKRKGPTRRSVVVSGSAFCLLSLVGCELPGSGPAPRRIRLSAADSFPPNMPAVAWTLQVQEPTTTLSLDTARIAIGVADDITYLATGEWASRAPEMVMELLVQSFRNSNKILTVGDRRARIRPEFDLQLRLSAFHIEKTAEDAGTVRVGLDTTLVKRPQRDPLATSGFESSAQVSPLTLDDIVTAFDESLRDVMEQVVEWTLRTGANA
jgi:cholesterol transport system auxiliary component